MRFDIHKADENSAKYLVPPSWEYIEDFINEIGISQLHFERYYGFPKGHLGKVKCGYMELGRSYWHFFYERIVPQYGAGFAKQANLTNTTPKTIPKSVPNVAYKPANVAQSSASVAHLPDNHTRLTTVK